MDAAFSKSRRGGAILAAAWLAAAGAAARPMAAEDKVEAGSGTAPETEKDAEERKLRQVRGEIEKLRASLEGVQREQKSLLGDLQSLDIELSLHQRQLLVAEADLRKCRREISESTLRVEQIQTRLGDSRRALAARLRALYISGPPVFERVVLTARQPAEVVEAYRVASLVARSDADRIEAYRSDLRQLQGALAQLEERTSRLTSLRSQEMAKQRELEGLRADRSRLLERVRREATEQQDALAEMAETERELQRLVQTLSAGGAVSPERRIGFEKFRRLLPWPVPGKVLVPFGARKNARFDTRVPHPGIDLEVAVGQPVRAVFDGVVAFSDWFKGYGNLVILEHGGSFMTIYAHLSERRVEAGDRIVSGQIIARAGDTGSLEGPRLYFEIWRDGKPEDPLPWLARR